MISQSYIKLQRQIRLWMPPSENWLADFHFYCFTSCSILFMVPLSLVFWFIGLPELAVGLALSAAGVTATLILRKMETSLFVCTQFYQAILVGIVVFGSWKLGGLSSSGMVWLGIVPILPWFVMSRGWTLTWLILCFVIVWFFLWLHLHGWLVIKPGFTSVDLTVSAIMFSLLCVTQGILVVTLDVATSELLDSMKNTAVKLNQSNAQLQEANLHKDRFLAMVSHAMRTPLNGVMGYLNLLTEQPELRPDSLDQVAGAKNAASHLLTVINDLLDLSQISQGRFSLSPQVASLNQTVTEIFKTLEINAQQMGLEYKLVIDPDLPEWVRCDSDRIAQILINLLGNAIKFTDKGTIEMRVSCRERLRDIAKLKFSIKDTGQGIAKQDLEHIFDPFFQTQEAQTKNAETGVRGNGLGLAISKSLAEAMNGQLSVESQIGKGSVFTFEVDLPVVDAPANLEIEKPTELLIDVTPFKLLLVDDQPVNRAVLKATLKKSLPHASFDEAEGGVKALELLMRDTYDLVLIDLVMPDIDGVEVVKRVRQNFPEPYAAVPFIAITANIAPQALKDCEAAGIAEVMPKPFNRDSLLRSIQKHARRQI
jgi:signal transduction histidine kinase/CheY-like chemotaxis protein